VACGSCVRVLYRVLTIQRMSLRSASGALDEMAKHDPRRALREAERRRARRERNAIDERNLALGTPTQRSSAHRPSSAPFDSSTGRFDDPLTRHLREQIAPGAYEQSHATVATLGACSMHCSFSTASPFELETSAVPAHVMPQTLVRLSGSNLSRDRMAQSTPSSTRSSMARTTYACLTAPWRTQEGARRPCRVC
jgi:hypothetical protein